MRRWRALVLSLLTLLIGISALYVWAAPLLGPSGRNVTLTETNGLDLSIRRGDFFYCHQQGSDPTPPPAGDQVLYCKSTGWFIRDSAGTIVGPLGTGGGGGGGTVGLKDAVRVATTANITLFGEQTIDSVLTASSRVLVKDQTTPAQNGLYVSGAGTWLRAADADVAAEFTPSFLVPVGTGGSTNQNTVWMFATVGSVTLNTTAITFTKTAYGPSTAAFELLTNRNVSSGYPSLTSEVKQIWTQHGDADTHAPLAAAGQISPTAATMRVSGSGGPVTMPSGSGGNPRITGCTEAAMDGVELNLEGDHATNTLTIPNGQGVQLCGNTGSVTLGLNSGRARFVCHFATTTWRQQDCFPLQSAVNTSKALTGGPANIDGLTTAGNALCTGDFVAGNYCCEYSNVKECYCSGVLCTTQSLTNPVFTMSGSKPTCTSGARSQRWDTLGGAGISDVAEVCAKDATDAYAWRAPGTRTTTTRLPLDTINFADANASVQPDDRTDYDTMVTSFVDTGTGCVHFKTYVPPNLASTPNWNVILEHSAASGAGGPIQLTLAAKTFGSNVPKTAAFTGLTLASAGVVTVSTSANTTITTLGATNFDAQVAIAANQLLRLTLCRTPGSAGDTLGVNWLLEHTVLRIDTN